MMGGDCVERRQWEAEAEQGRHAIKKFFATSWKRVTAATSRAPMSPPRETKENKASGPFCEEL